VYVTVVCDSAGRTAAYGPAATADPPAPPDDGPLACTAPLCPTSGLDRTTGRITDPNHIMRVDRTLAIAIAIAIAIAERGSRRAARRRPRAPRHPAPGRGRPLRQRRGHQELVELARQPVRHRWRHLPERAAHQREGRCPMSRATPGRPPLRVAFYGRLGCDSDDTELSLVRQYEQCRRVLPPQSLTAVFYDVGSGPVNRPHPAPARLTIRAGVDAVRDGGLADLLAEATSANRRFDCLITCGPDRVSRDSQRAVELMNELERATVPCLFPEGDGQILTPCPAWPLDRLAGIRAWRSANDGDPR
jgi:hypothetical protein